MTRSRRPRPLVTAPSGFTWFRFPPEVILLAVRWHLRSGLSYRDLEELLAERGIEVDHVTLYRWAQRFTPWVIDVCVSQRRDIASARTFFTAALTVHGDPTEVITNRAPALANVIEDLIPASLHNTGQYENNRLECDHGRLKAGSGRCAG